MLLSVYITELYMENYVGIDRDPEMFHSVLDCIFRYRVCGSLMCMSSRIHVSFPYEC